MYFVRTWAPVKHGKGIRLHEGGIMGRESCLMWLQGLRLALQEERLSSLKHWATSPTAKVFSYQKMKSQVQTNLKQAESLCLFLWGRDIYLHLHLINIMVNRSKIYEFSLNYKGRHFIQNNECLSFILFSTMESQLTSLLLLTWSISIFIVIFILL